MPNSLQFSDHTLSSWHETVDAINAFAETNWVFRGHSRADWSIETTLWREFGGRGADVERELLWRFVRLAPPLLPSHLVPHDNDAAAWLGLVQHYGGPTRLLDVTRSPYVALFFAFEPAGGSDRALWAIDYGWCMAECGRIMAENEGKPLDEILPRTVGAQAQLVYSLVHRQPYSDPLFASFKPFTGVFAVNPWKPDQRQIAQQAMFLCAANPALTLVENLTAHVATGTTRLYRLVIPGSLREEIIWHLARMNVTAASLFPDLGGLARSLRTLAVETPLQQPHQLRREPR
jgi:hypothetical protein